MRRPRVLVLLAALLMVPLPPATGQTPAAPAVGSDPRVSRALELARTWLEAQRAYDQLPGLSAALVHDQQLLWSGGFGVADVASGRPAKADTVYSICSISKLFTAVAVMQQRDAGRLRLDDPVGRHLPWFTLKQTEGEGEITVEGLLTHASGLPRESDSPYWSGPDFAFPSHDQIVARLKEQKALYVPATRFQYSNLGLALAGEVASAAAGAPYAEVVRKGILDPLGLASTTPEMPEAERGKRLATGYSSMDRDGRRRALPFFSTKGIAPAAGFASTVDDLARFASWQFRLLARGGSEVLKATTLREMHRIHWAEPDFKTLWGLGFAIVRDGEENFVGHGGSCPGFRSSLLLSPAHRTAAVVMVNAQHVDTGNYTLRLQEILAPAVKEAVKEPGKGKATDPGLLRYAGSYDDAPWDGETAVLPWGDGLAMLALPTTQPVKDLQKLKKTGEHTFRRLLKDDSLGEEIVFEMGADGNPTGLRRHSNVHPRKR